VGRPASSPPQTERPFKRPERSQLSPCVSDKRGGHWPGATDLPLLVLHHSRRGPMHTARTSAARLWGGSGQRAPTRDAPARGARATQPRPGWTVRRRSHGGHAQAPRAWPAGAASLPTSQHTTLSALGKRPVTVDRRGPRGGPPARSSAGPPTSAVNRRRRFEWLSDDLGAFGRGLGPADAFESVVGIFRCVFRRRPFNGALATGQRRAARPRAGRPPETLHGPSQLWRDKN